MNLHVLHQGQQSGPHDEATLRARLAGGQLGPEDLAWQEGMNGWKPLREVFPALFAGPVVPPAPVGSPFSPAGFPPSPTPFHQMGPGQPAGPRPAGGIPTWFKLLMAAGVAVALVVILVIGLIGYRVYRTQQTMRNLRVYKTETRTDDAPPVSRQTPRPRGEDAEAINNQGFALYTAKDYTGALPLFQRAADLGHPQAQHNLGVMALYGQGVPKSPDEALRWFGKAAAQGYASSQGQLGLCYAFYEGFPHDYPKAVAWLQKAAAQDNAQAINNLAAMYEDGLGVPKDITRAREGYQRAAALGYEQAKKNLARLGASASAPTPTPAAARPPSSFAGRWQGPWNDAGTNQRGTFTFTVSPDGSFQGETRNDTGRTSGPLRGSLDPDGNLRASYSYGSGAGAGSYTAAGRLTRQGGRLTGKVDFFMASERIGGATVELTGGNGSPTAASPAVSGSSANTLTEADKRAMMAAVVTYLRTLEPGPFLQKFTGNVLSREDDAKIDTETNTDLASGKKTTTYTVLVPAKFEKGSGAEKFTMRRTGNGWEVADYARELKGPRG